MTYALEHVVVVELTTGIAGAYATKLLRDVGADVVKIEPPHGDPLRRRNASGTVPPAGEDGVLYGFLNGGKRNVLRTIATDVITSADIVVAPPEVVRDASGVLITLSDFGRGGPWTGRPASDYTLAAWSGAPYGRGTPDRPPLASGGHVGEYATGVMVAALALGYLGWRIELDVSMLECIVVTNGMAGITAQLAGGQAPAQRNIETPSIEQAKDGYVGFAIVTAQQLRDFWLLIDKPEWIDHLDYLSMRQRWQRRDEINAAVRAWTSTRTVRDIVEAAALLRIPAVPVGNGALLPEIEQLAGTGAYVPSPNGRSVQPAPAFLFSTLSTAPPAAASPVGADSPPARPASAARAAPVGRAEPVTAPLAGQRVLSFTNYWAGPYAASVLAALGADVVLVESIQRPDGMRFMSVRSPTEDRWWEWSGMFHGVNAGKRGITLELDDPEGRSLVEQLIASRDIVIENYSPRVLEHFGLDYEGVRRIRPDVIMARMPAFGLSGPWRDRTGFAMTIEQVSGLAWLSGYADRDPIVPRGPCDPLAGLHTLVAVLAALEYRNRTGEGQLIEVPMLRTAINVTADQVLEYQEYGVLLTRKGNQIDNDALQGYFRCRDLERASELGRDPDRYIAVSAHSGEQRGALADVIGSGSTADGDLRDALARWCRGRVADVAADELWRAGVPVAVLDPMSAAHENPQLRGRGFWESHDHSLAGPLDYAGLPARVVINGEVTRAAWHRRPAPQLGEHTVEVLSELGVTRTQLDALAARGVIGDRPRGAGKPI